MNKMYLLVIAVALVAAPMAFAHTDGNPYGTPKTYCETQKVPPDTNVHDYVVVGAPVVSLPWRILPPYTLTQFVDGNMGDCDGDGVPGDFDGHSEWAVGGAWLLSSEAGFPVSGATACFGEARHHPIGPRVWVFDHIWPSGVKFIVGADFTNFPSGGVDCGTFVDSVSTPYCIDHCDVEFGPGLDGSYHVYVVSEVAATSHPVVDSHRSDESGINGHLLCVEDPGFPGTWHCVHGNFAGLDPHFAMVGHVYT